MQFPFYKYQGTGNDFVMIDDRSLSFPVETSLIERLCDRRFGIGGDGLILIQPADGYDFKMVYFNADGNEGTMCGNGGRCAVRFASDLGIIGEKTHFIAVDGPHDAIVTPETISLKMIDVTGVNQYDDHDFLNTGSPHYIAFVDKVEEVPVYSLGSAIRYGNQYGPLGGTNVNFVEVKEPNSIKIRTYERGVEDETFSCGTGATAAAIAHYLRNGADSSVAVEVVGGQLHISFEPKEGTEFTNIWLTGPAQKVYSGTIDLN